MLSAIEAIAVAGEWTRHAPAASDMLGRAHPPVDGRWQRGDVVPALYLADGVETAHAEWYRWLAEHGLSPELDIPHAQHHWRVTIEVANLASSARLAAVGLGAPRPAKRDWAPFQKVGERLWREGWAGLLAPSAARPQSQVLCVFADRWPPVGCRPLRAAAVEQVPPPPVGMTT